MDFLQRRAQERNPQQLLQQRSALVSRGRALPAAGRGMSVQGGSQANFNWGPHSCGLICPCQMPQASRFERDQTALSFIFVLSYLWRARGGSAPRGAGESSLASAEVAAGCALGRGVGVGPLSLTNTSGSLHYPHGLLRFVLPRLMPIY